MNPHEDNPRRILNPVRLPFRHSGNKVLISVSTDQPFLDAVNREHPMWEADAIEWVYRIEEVQTWRERLQKVLREL